MSGGEILLILVAVLVLFGADKMPGIARGIGKGMREFQKAADEIKAELTNSTSEIREEMNNIRSDFRQNVSEVKPNLDEIKSTLNTSVESNEMKVGKPVSRETVNEGPEKKAESHSKTDEDNKSFTDQGANI
jgi:TatA/E family protein of Tat protein translocase